MKPDRSQPQRITASIIIPMRNEEGYVARCLDSVLAQIEGRDDIEVICVDGASEDGTRRIVQDYARRYPCVILLDNPRKIVPVAMNLALDRARGEAIIRLDCHAEYDPDYIEKCLEVLRRSGADNVGGYVRTVPSSDTRSGRAIAAALSSRFGVGGSVFRTGGGERQVDTVPFGCFRRDVFDRFGRYDERLVRNQDIELCTRIRARGGRIIISPQIRLTYYSRSTFGGMCRQAFANGLWNVYTLYLIRGGIRLRHLVPFAFVMSLLVLGVGGIFWRPLWVLLGAELLVYFAAATWMAVGAGREKRTSVPLVVLAFLLLHLSYGTGSLWGMLTAVWRFGLARGRTSAPPPAR